MANYSKIVINILLLFTAIGFSEESIVKRFYFSKNQLIITENDKKQNQNKRPRIGLALSGGGIRGIAQIGVLDAFDENNIKIDLIAGTSIGAAVGALYSSGYTPDEIMNLVRSVDWNRVFEDQPERSSLFLGEKKEKNRALLNIPMNNFKPVMPESFSAGQQVTKILTDFMLNALYHDYDFSNLDPPLIILATDMLSGHQVLLQEGDLVQAVRSSIAIPLLFSPVKKDGMILIDGGISCNIPVEHTRKNGADIVIAVNSTSPLRPESKIEAPWEVADQVTTIMQKSKNDEQLASADYVIDFSDLDFISTQYDAMDSLFQIGKQRALCVVDSLNNTKGNIIFFTKLETKGPVPQNLQQLQSPLPADSLLQIMYTIKEQASNPCVEAQLVADSADTLLRITMSFHKPLHTVEFFGNRVLSDSVLLQPFKPLLQIPYNESDFQNAVEYMLRIYRKQGYSLAEVDTVLFDPELGVAGIHLNEGYIRNIHFIGNTKTRDFIISREFLLKSGDIFIKANAESGIDNVYATGLFHSVLLGWKKVQDQYDIKVYTYESQSQNLRIGVRYDSERYTKAFIEYADENVGGLGNDAVFHAQYGIRDFETLFQYRADRIFKTYLTAQLDVHYHSSEHDAYRMLHKVGKYQRHATGIILQMGQQLARFGTISGYLRFEEIDLDSIRGSGYDRGNMNINTIGFKTTIDTRDQLPFPRSGTFHTFSYEASSGFMLGADESFNKVENQLSGYKTFFKRHTFNSLLRWGISDRTTPYSEQFRMGGYDSFYGLHQEQLWGRYLFLVSMGYRCRCPKLGYFPLFLSLRYDLGSTWDEVEEITPQDFLSGYGASIDLQTPLGPICVAYGRINKEHKAVYVNFGFQF